MRLFWFNAREPAGSLQLFWFLERGREGSLIDPEPASSVSQRFPQSDKENLSLLVLG